MLPVLPKLFPKWEEPNETTNLSSRTWGASFRGLTPSKVDVPAPNKTVEEVIEVLPMPICLVDPSGNIRKSNPEFRSFVDLSNHGGEGEGERVNILEMLSMKDTDRFYSRLAEVKAAKGPCKLEVGSCATKTVLHGAHGIRLVHWTMSRTASSEDHDLILVSAIFANPSPSSPHHSGSGLGSNKFSILSSDDEDGVHNALPSAAWASFKERVEHRTNKLIADKVARVKSKAAAELSDTRRGFIRHMSHEVRTPLNIIATGLAVIRQRAESLDVSAVEIVDDLSAASYDAAGILDDFIAYEKLDGGALALERRPLDFVPVLDRCLGSLRLLVSLVVMMNYLLS